MPKTTEETPPEPRVQPNIEAIIELLKPGGQIDEAAKASSDAMSKTGRIFQNIEKNFNGNRAAVSLIRRMQKMSADKRADFIRTVEPLMVHYGYTLDAIDPEDLLERDSGTGAPEPGAGEQSGGGNAPVSGLDAARAKLSGVDTAGAEQRAAAANGSVQLRKFLGAIRAGMEVEVAAKIGEIDSLDEAKEHVAAEKRGEYADVPSIEPPAKRGGKPRLGIVTPTPDTKQ